MAADLQVWRSRLGKVAVGGGEAGAAGGVLAGAAGGDAGDGAMEVATDDPLMLLS